eukprot:1012419-Pyramimonas_sp.AAC.1
MHHVPCCSKDCVKPQKGRHITKHRFVLGVIFFTFLAARCSLVNAKNSGVNLRAGEKGRRSEVGANPSIRPPRCDSDFRVPLEMDFPRYGTGTDASAAAEARL